MTKCPCMTTWDKNRFYRYKAAEYLGFKDALKVRESSDGELQH